MIESTDPRALLFFAALGGVVVAFTARALWRIPAPRLTPGAGVSPQCDCPGASNAGAPLERVSILVYAPFMPNE